MRALAVITVLMLAAPALADDGRHVQACASAYRAVEEYPDSFRLLVGFAEKTHDESLRTPIRYIVNRGLESPTQMVLRSECHFDRDTLVRAQKFGPVWFHPDQEEFKFMRAAAIVALKTGKGPKPAE